MVTPHLERAYTDHAADILFMNIEPLFDPIREDPRFQELVRRIGLVPRPPTT